MVKIDIRHVGGLALLVLAASCSSPSAVDAADTNDDEQVSVEEVRHYLSDEVYRVADADGSGSVSPAELKQLDPALGQQAFQERDANGDGGISKEEVVAHMERNKSLDPILKGLDDDQDGIVEVAEAREHLEQLQTGTGATQ